MSYPDGFLILEDVVFAKRLHHQDHVYWWPLNATDERQRHAWHIPPEQYILQHSADNPAVQLFSNRKYHVSLTSDNGFAVIQEDTEEVRGLASGPRRFSRWVAWDAVSTNDLSKGGSNAYGLFFFKWGAISWEAIIECKRVPRDASVGKSGKLIFAQFVCCTLSVLDMSDQALVTRFQLYKLSAQQWGELRSSQGTHSQISCRIATVTIQASAWQLGDSPGVKIFRSFESNWSCSQA